MKTLREQIKVSLFEYEQDNGYAIDDLVNDVARLALEAAKTRQAERDTRVYTAASAGIAAAVHAGWVKEIDALLEELNDEA